MSFECCNYRCVCQGTHENPELIWNDEAREKVCSTVRQMKDEYETLLLFDFISARMTLLNYCALFHVNVGILFRYRLARGKV